MFQITRAAQRLPEIASKSWTRSGTRSGELKDKFCDVCEAIIDFASQGTFDVVPGVSTEIDLYALGTCILASLNSVSPQDIEALTLCLLFLFTRPYDDDVVIYAVVYLLDLEVMSSGSLR